MLLELVIAPIIGGLFGLFGEFILSKYHFFAPKNVNLNTSHSFFSSFKALIKFEIKNYFSFWIALITSLLVLIGLIYWTIQALHFPQIETWHKEISYQWIPLVGIQFHLYLESISLLFCLLTSILTLIAILYSHTERRQKSGLFYLCLLAISSFTMMILTAQDLFLFFLLWEAIAIPFYFVMVLWGRKKTGLIVRFNGASKFIIYTQISAVIILIAILTLVLKNQQLTDIWTFNYIELGNTPISIYLEITLLLCFLIVFFIRLPLFPFHSWFIEAHRNASTTGSIMLSSLFCISTLYCFMKFIFVLFPNALCLMQNGIMIFALITAFFGALACFKQKNIKSLISYAHLSIIGLILSIIFYHSIFALQGVILITIGTSFAMSGLFLLSSLFTKVYGTPNINKIKHIQISTKLLSTLMMLFILLLTGLPGSANFTGILMMVVGSFSVSPYYMILFVIALLFLATALILRMQPLFFGEKTIYHNYSSRHHRFETLLLILILVFLFYIGLMPQWMIDLSFPWLEKIEIIIKNAQMTLVQGDI